MNYEAVEQELVTRLNGHFIANEIDQYFIAAVMPDTEADAKAFEALFPKSTVAVEYKESNYQKSNGLGHVKQDESVRFRLLCEARKMRGPGGLFTLIRECKNSLIGYRVQGSTNGLTVVNVGQQQFESGVWLPYIDIECNTLNVQAFEDSDEIGGPFKSITYPNEQFSSEFNNSFQ
jgi:hypothetical protein